jgi:hypothetical protein
MAAMWPFLLAGAAIAVIVGGLWVDYTVNWRNTERRGFEVKLNTGETPVPQKDTNHGPAARVTRKDDHG